MLMLLDASGARPLAAGDADADADADGALTVALADDAVVAHRIALGDTTDKGRMEEARMRATDLSAQPVDELQLALGPLLPDGSAWLALVSRARLAAHLEALQAEGLEPTRLVPAALLLPEPDGSAPSVADSGANGALLVRGRDFAGTVEPALAEAVGADPAAMRPALGDLLRANRASDAPNLLTGAFAPQRRWWRERGFQLAAATLLLLALLLAVAPLLLARQQLASAAAGHDAETLAIAERALGRAFDDPAAAGAALSEARRAREQDMLSARLSAVAAAQGAVPRARVEAIRSDAAGLVTLSLGGPADAINQLRGRLETGAFLVGGQGTELTLGDRRGAEAVGDDAGAIALARRYNAARDAAILAATPVPSGAPPALAPVLDAAGLVPEAAGEEEAEAAGASATLLPAARPTVLLPLIARLEQQGVRFARVEIRANDDQTVRALLVRRP